MELTEKRSTKSKTQINVSKKVACHISYKYTQVLVLLLARHWNQLRSITTAGTHFLLLEALTSLSKFQMCHKIESPCFTGFMHRSLSSPTNLKTLSKRIISCDQRWDINAGGALREHWVKFLHFTGRKTKVLGRERKKGQQSLCSMPG